MPEGGIAPRETDSDELARSKPVQQCDCPMSTFCRRKVRSQKERNGIWVREV